MTSIKAAELDYGKVAGYPPLREAIAEYVSSSRGTRCTAEQVHVTTGAQSALGLACTMLLDAGDRAWMEEPGYPGARSALTAAGARIGGRARGPGRARRGGRGQEGARRAHGDRDAVPPVPAGRADEPARPAGAARLGERRPAWVVEDDYDSEFRYGAPPCRACTASTRRPRRLRRQLREEPVPGAPARLPDRAARPRAAVPPGAALSTDVHSATLEQVALAEFIGAGPLRAPPARHAFRRIASACRRWSDAAVGRCG
jgi:GntR family transcriptional regulator/MocR family aminotransferase